MTVTQGTMDAQYMESCRKAFSAFDKNNSGTIDSKELKSALQALGHCPSDEELFVMMSLVDEDQSGEIEFTEFIKAAEAHRLEHAGQKDESDTIEAFLALGGNADKSGTISVEKLQATLQEFGLTIDLSSVLKELDKDRNGIIDYTEFKQLLTT
eukprot:jgi/Botrbrau1/21068/Bobra.0144s0067.1